MIEAAYRLGEATGLAVWTEDEAGPFQPVPYPDGRWAGSPTVIGVPASVIKDAIKDTGKFPK